jgi:hypothetical protein
LYAVPEELKHLYELVAASSQDNGVSILAKGSPQNQAFTWLGKNASSTMQQQDRILQRYALAALYYSTDGPNWLNNRGWLSDDDECTWFSSLAWPPSCSNGVYTNLNLAWNNLGGIIPPEMMLLTGLKSIQLNGGEPNTVGGARTISGTLPSEIGLLTNLRTLDLSSNSFFGEIPSELGSLTNLVFLHLGTNRFSFPIPEEIFQLSSLQTLNLSLNDLTGEIPSNIDGLPNLEIFSLGNNKLSGVILLGHKSTALREIDMEKNQFSAFEAPAITLATLEVLKINENRLSGRLASEIGNMSNLTWLSAHNNLLDGPIPSQLGNLTLLKVLNLSFNQFSGSIPKEICSLPIDVLELQSNHLSGEIPEEFGNFVGASTIRLDDNNFSGSASPLCFFNEFSRTVSYGDCFELTESYCFEICCIDGQGCEMRP